MFLECQNTILENKSIKMSDTGFCLRESIRVMNGYNAESLILARVIFGSIIVSSLGEQKGQFCH